MHDTVLPLCEFVFLVRHYWQQSAELSSLFLSFLVFTKMNASHESAIQECILCFSVPVAAKHIAEHLDKPASLPSHSDAPIPPPHRDYSLLLKYIHKRVAQQFTDDDRLNQCSENGSRWYCGSFSERDSRFRFHCDPTALVAWLTATTSSCSHPPWRGLQCVLSRRDELCKTRGCSPSAVPVVVVVLQRDDFPFLCGDAPRAQLPPILRDIYCSEGMRVWGLPPPVIPPGQVLVTDRAVHGGPIAFVSSEFLVNSFFFHRMCVLHDFLYDPLQGSLVEKGFGVAQMIPKPILGTARKRRRSLSSQDYIREKAKDLLVRFDDAGGVQKCLEGILETACMDTYEQTRQAPLPPQRSLQESVRETLRAQIISESALQQVVWECSSFLTVPCDKKEPLSNELADAPELLLLASATDLSENTVLNCARKSIVDFVSRRSQTQNDNGSHMATGDNDYKLLLLTSVLERHRSELHYIMRTISSSELTQPMLEVVRAFWEDIAAEAQRFDVSSSEGECWTGREAFHLFLKRHETPRASEPMHRWREHLCFLSIYAASANAGGQSTENTPHSPVDSLGPPPTEKGSLSVTDRQSLALMRGMNASLLSVNEYLVCAEYLLLSKLTVT